nr:unnamed protein product [Callosobruchus chinensis]
MLTIPNDTILANQCSEDYIEKDGFANRLVFNDEATFHLCGKVNRHNLRFWGSENPHAILEHVRDSPKTNVFCAIPNRHVFGPFFFAEKTATGIVYADLLSEWLMPQLEEKVPDFVFQQDGAPPHWHNSVREHLNEHLPRRWIGRARVNLPFLLWLPRSPDLIPCDFFLWRYVKHTVFKPPLPLTLDELKQCICAAIDAITSDMLQPIWEELDYRLDVCRITRGAHIEHL